MKKKIKNYILIYKFNKKKNIILKKNYKNYNNLIVNNLIICNILLFIAKQNNLKNIFNFLMLKLIKISNYTIIQRYLKRKK